MKAVMIPWLVIALALSPLAQDGPGDPLEWKSFRSVLNLLHDREFDRALPELERFTGSRVPEIAARAHIELGVYYLDRKPEPERALPYLNEVAKNPKYLPFAATWSQAAYRVGQIKLSRAATREQLQDAQADFDRVYRTYPDTGVSADALFASARVAERLQDYDGAMDKYQRIRGEYGNSRSTPQAIYNLARHVVLKGDTKAGLLYLQEIRTRFPDGEHAKRALAALNGLYRFYRRTLAPEGSPNPYGAPAEVIISDVKELADPYSMLINDADDLFLVDRLKKLAFKFQSNGRVTQTLPLTEPAALALGPDGALYAAERDTVRKLQAKNPPTWRLTYVDGKGETRPVRRIGALAVSSVGDFYAVDPEARAVFKYSAVQKRGELFPPQQNLRTVQELIVDALDNVYLLDEKEGRVLIYSALGEPLGQVVVGGGGRAGGPAGGPVAMAIGGLNHLYVLDRGGAFQVYELRYKPPRTMDAKLVTRAAFSGRFKEAPQTIAVSAQGRVFVTAKKTGTVLMFR